MAEQAEQTYLTTNSKQSKQVRSDILTNVIFETVCEYFNYTSNHRKSTTWPCPLSKKEEKGMKRRLEGMTGGLKHHKESFISGCALEYMWQVKVRERVRWIKKN